MEKYYNTAIRTYMIFAVIVMFNLFVTTAFAESENPLLSKEIPVYSVNDDSFRDFVLNPTIEYLEQNNEHTECLFTMDAENLTLLSKRTINGKDEFEVLSNGNARIGNVSITTQEIKDFEKNLTEVLNNNEISDKIVNYAIVDRQTFTHSEVPVTVLVETEASDYFLTLNENVLYYGETLSYNFYKKDEYLNKFGLYDGALILNGTDITNGSYVKFEYTSVYVPLRTFAEALEAKVEWDGDRQRAVIEKAEKKYVLRLNEYPHFVSFENAETIELQPWGETGVFCKIINDRIVIDEALAKDIAATLEAAVSIDYDNHIINVIK